MRRFRVNEALNLASKYAVLYYAQCYSVMNNNPTEYKQTTSTYRNTESGIRFDVKKIWICPEMAVITDSGLGSLPTGIKDILIPTTITTTTFGKFSSSLFSTPSKDVVFVGMNFNTQEDCQVAKSMASSDKYNSLVWNDDNFSTGNCKMPDDWPESDDPIYCLVVPIVQD